MKNKYLLFTSFTLLFTGFCHAGSAQHGGAYLGISAGQGNSDIKTHQFTAPDACKLEDVHCTFDDNGDVWQIYGGANITPYMAVEGAYVDLGNTAKFSDGVDVTGKQDTKGFSISAVGKVPVGASTNVYGKAGIFKWDTDAKVSDGYGSESADGSGTDPTLGVGVEYKMGPHWSARVGWDRYYNVGEKNNMLDSAGVHTLKTDVDVYSIGVQYDF